MTDTDRERLHASLNMELHIVVSDKGQRGIHIIWSRTGQDGMTIWDDSGCWEQMPERIEAASYGGVDFAKVYAPVKRDFFAQAKKELGIEAAQAAEILKANGYTNGYDFAKAAAMYEVLKNE